jgi:hypothetical protein
MDILGRASLRKQRGMLMLLKEVVEHQHQKINSDGVGEIEENMDWTNTDIT